MKKSIAKGIRELSSAGLLLYACGAWLSTCTARATDSDVIPIGHIVRTTGCLVAAYIGHRALCLLCSEAETDAASELPTADDSWMNRPANEDPH